MVSVRVRVWSLGYREECRYINRGVHRVTAMVRVGDQG